MHSNTRVEFSQSGLGDTGMSYNVRPITLFLLWLLTTLSRPPTASAQTEVCDGESFRATCPDGEDILMTDAKYGRMRIGRCVARDYGELGCHKDVLAVLDRLCSGMQSCEVLVNRGNEQLSQGNPCPQDFSPYLDASYRCIKVKQVPSHCPANGEARVAGQQGMIPSHVTDSTGCGDLDTPWVIEASPGQRINVSIVDFGWTTRDNGGLQPSSQCDVYGYISERRLGMNNTLCGGLARERHVYYSASNVIEIQLLRTTGHLPATFLLQYNVVGCPDMSPPQHAWYKRNGSTAVIGCEWSEHSWHLKCEDSTWVGVVGNCSGGAVEKPPTEKGSIVLSPMLSVSLIVGLGSLVVVLLCTIVIGYCCCRRDAKAERRTEQQQHPFGATYEGQAFLYHPGRPVPLQGNPGTIRQQQVPPWMMHDQTMPTKADDLLHIWETPLPEPMTNPQDDSGIVSEPTYASLPSRGTMTGSCPSQEAESRVAAGDGVMAGDVTWPGTRAFYEHNTVTPK